MKKNVILAILGVVLSMGLFSCAQGAPSGMAGTWRITEGLPYVADGSWFEILDDGTVNWSYVLSGDDVYESQEFYKIKTNSCNVLEMTDGTKFDYELGTNTMVWKYHSDDGISGAIAGAIAGNYASFVKE